MEEDIKDPEQSENVSGGIIKFLTISFLAAMYLVIFMKILFIK